MMTRRFSVQVSLAVVQAAVLLRPLALAAAPAQGSSCGQEFAYCTTDFDRVFRLYQYRIAHDGTLHPLKPPTIALKYEPWPSSFAAPGHRALYVPLKGAILQYHIENDGTLRPLAPASVPDSSVQNPVFARGGRFVYADQVRGVILQYTVSASGALRPLAPPSLESGHGGCLGLVLSPDGRTLYSLNYDCTIGQFRVGGDGRLSPLSPGAVPAAPPGQSIGPPHLALGPGAEYAYAAADGPWIKAWHAPESFLTVCRVRGDGTLQQLSTSAVRHIGGVLVQGQTLFAWRRGIDQYHIASDGRLVPGKTVPAPGSAFAFTPSGRYAYQVGDGVYRYRCQPDGSLVLLSKDAHAFGDSVYVDPSGRFLYTRWYSTRGGGVLQFKIGTDGQVTPLNPPSVSLACTNLVIVRLPAPKPKGKAGAKPAARGTPGPKQSAGKGATKRR